MEEEPLLSASGTGQNIIVLDLETAHSAGELETGWKDKIALGLSIGCFWSYPNNVMHWFDMYNLLDTVRVLVADQPVMVSFNGISFDFDLICALIHDYADDMSRCPQNNIELFIRSQEILHALGAAFDDLASRSYDILAEIWKIDPENRFNSSLNSLNVICQQSGLGPKLSSGAQAPKDWQAGRIAKVLNYCQDDVQKTRELFEMICRGNPIIRGDGQPILMPRPRIQAAQARQEG